MRIGLIRYSTTAQIVFGLSDYVDANTLKSHIQSLTRTGGSSNLASGLQIAQTAFQSSTSAAKVIVVLTDSQSDGTSSSVSQANTLKSSNVKIIGVTLNMTSLSSGIQELQQIVSNSAELSMLAVPDSSYLTYQTSNLAIAACIYRQSSSKYF